MAREPGLLVARPPLDRLHRAGLAPQQRDLSERSAGILLIEPDAIVDVVEQQLAATAKVGIDDLDVRNPERGVLRHEDLADRLGLARGDPDPARVLLQVLE